ncbi:U-box domain-containing protein 52-like [Prunus dulcis]|uniref:U-box domain-containing protein 52-like n=1 Tax=Prunus dulcis TaxID=3755 RepID=UPI00148266E5|nr:U-box domain-containing protein 52-like [Prunus dulcis]
MGLRGKPGKKEESVAVAVDKDKGSQHAIKWTVDNLLSRGQNVTLLHVKETASHHHNHHHHKEAGKVHQSQADAQAKELFLPFRGYCTKKAIKCHEIIIEDTDVSKALVNYVTTNLIEILVLGTPSKNGLFRFMTTDVPTIVSKKAPDFCTVYVIGRGKISIVRSATGSVPERVSPPPQEIEHHSSKASESYPQMRMSNHKPRAPERTQFSARRHPNENEIMSPFSRGNSALNKSYEIPPDSDISYVSSGTPGRDHMFPSFYDSMSSGMTSRFSINSDLDSRSSTSTASYSGTKFMDMSSLQHDFSSPLRNLSSPQDDVDAEMRRLRLELKHTRDMYNAACKEGVTEKHKAKEVNRWKLEEELRLEEARTVEEAALSLVGKEKAKCRAAMEAAEAAQRIAELETQKRRNVELKALKEAEHRKTALESNAYDLRYRKYTIEEIETATNDFSAGYKIGEGGYGPVYRGELDHTPVAIKVLRPDAAHGEEQFKKEVEVLSCIRHPNMVLLLGACPEFGCLVYEYMANGSLEDCLFRRGNTPVIPWQLRFRIAAEIATGLLFLHQTKPEPLVHRDLKPGNILLDHNYVSKISDVGLARLVPASVANSVTQYHMTSTAGTFCYIDPEYQQTGLLGVKSDVYSLGVLLLQIITARPPMGLTHLVEEAIDTGAFAEVLDPAVSDWPIEEALKFAKLSLQCAEMRRKDRPNLGKVLLPELNRFREFGQDSMNRLRFGGSQVFSEKQGAISTRQDVISDTNLTHSGYDSSRSQSSASSYAGRRMLFPDLE